jgi:hypothetical protein
MALSGAARPGYAVTHPPIYAGTYAVRFCHGLCTGPGAASHATGVMVLFARPMLDAGGYEVHQQLQVGPVNGCMVLKPSPEARDERPGTGDDPPSSAWKFFAWALQQDGDTIAFQLDRSPDGGYEVDLKLVAAGLQGKGMSWGGAVGTPAGGTSWVPPFDQVQAERIGGPDIGRCPPMPRTVVVGTGHWLP